MLGVLPKSQGIGKMNEGYPKRKGGHRLMITFPFDGSI